MYRVIILYQVRLTTETSQYSTSSPDIVITSRDISTGGITLQRIRLTTKMSPFNFSNYYYTCMCAKYYFAQSMVLTSILYDIRLFNLYLTLRPVHCILVYVTYNVIHVPVRCHKYVHIASTCGLNNNVSLYIVFQDEPSFGLYVWACSNSTRADVQKCQSR